MPAVEVVLVVVPLLDAVPAVLATGVAAGVGVAVTVVVLGAGAGVGVVVVVVVVTVVALGAGAVVVAVAALGAGAVTVEVMASEPPPPQALASVATKSTVNLSSREKFEFIGNALSSIYTSRMVGINYGEIVEELSRLRIAKLPTATTSPANSHTGHKPKRDTHCA